MAPSNQLIWIFFVYGLAFFGMGLAILLEIGHISDRRLRYALRFLAVFGLVHGIHEWMEMFHLLGISPLQALDAESAGRGPGLRSGILLLGAGDLWGGLVTPWGHAAAVELSDSWRRFARVDAWDARPGAALW